MGANLRARTAYPTGAHEFTPGFSGIRVARSLVFCVVICTSLFVLLSDFLFAVVLCVPLRFTASDYPLYICIFKLFFLPQGRRSLALSLSPLSSTLLVLRLCTKNIISGISDCFYVFASIFALKCSLSDARKKEKNILSSCTYFKICKWDYNIVNRYFLRVARSIYRYHQWQCTCAKQKLAK